MGPKNGYFNATYGQDILGSAQHDEMANKYLDAMTTAISTAFPSTTTDVSKLVWTGLKDTDKWARLSPIEQGNINRVSYNNRTGAEGILCQ